MVIHDIHRVRQRMYYEKRRKGVPHDVALGMVEEVFPLNDHLAMGLAREGKMSPEHDLGPTHHHWEWWESEMTDHHWAFFHYCEKMDNAECRIHHYGKVTVDVVWND